MPKKKNRIIIDTNLWIHFLLTKDLSKLDKIISDEQLILIFSKELIEEFLEVTQRSKFRKFFNLEDIEELLLQINNKATFINIKSDIVACRDSKDNFLLALAVDGEATHIITGDKDLLVLEQFNKTKILTISEYLKFI
jgi:putative PIN family toxin of toxin-antitoxin system